MCVNFNCPCSVVDLFLFDSMVYRHINLKIHQLYEFVIYTSSQSGKERWQLMSKLVQFTSAFSWSNPKFLWQLKQHEVRFKCLHTTRSVNFSTNNTRAFRFSLHKLGWLQVSSKCFALYFLKGNSPGHLQKWNILRVS